MHFECQVGSTDQTALTSERKPLVRNQNGSIFGTDSIQINARQGFQKLRRVFVISLLLEEEQFSKMDVKIG